MSTSCVQNHQKTLCHELTTCVLDPSKPQAYAHGSKRRIPRMANDLELHQPDDGPATWSCNI
jgi:hypothetical protein